MKIRFLVSALLLPILLGCGGESAMETPSEVPPRGQFLDDPVLIETTGRVSASDIQEDVYTFDFGHFDFVREHRYDGFAIHGFVPSSIKAYWIRDSVLGVWVKHTMIGCGFQNPCASTIRLSATNPGITDYIDDSLKVSIQTAPLGAYDLGVEFFRWNPDYYGLSGRSPHGAWYSSLCFDGIGLWATAFPDTLYNLDLEGKILESVNIPVRAVYALTFGADSFWMAGQPRTRVYRISRSGEMEASFDHGRAIYDLAWFNGSLSVSEYDGDLRAFQLITLDVAASTESGHSVGTDTLVVNGVSLSAITWDGIDILVGHRFYDRLWRIAIDSGEVTTLPTPFSGISDLAWDGNGLWILHNGLSSFENDQPGIARFRLEPESVVSSVFITSEVPLTWRSSVSVLS